MFSAQNRISCPDFISQGGEIGVRQTSGTITDAARGMTGNGVDGWMNN